MKTSDAIKFFGSKKAIADALGIHKTAVSKWGDEIPTVRAIQLSHASNGALPMPTEAYPPSVRKQHQHEHAA